MTGRRTILGLCLACALAFSALGAQSASAGQTFFTCVETPTPEFVTEHCVSSDVGTKKFGHVDWQGSTHGKVHNLKTNSTTTGPTNEVFKETIAATNFELESTGTVEGFGTVTNEVVGGEARGVATTDENGVIFAGVVVKAPAGKGCVVHEDKGGVEGTEGVIKTKPLKARTTVVTDKENGEGVAEERHSIIVEPVEGTGLATFFVKCEKGKGVPEALEGTWEVTGTLTGTSHGATVNFNHFTNTEANTLKGKGAKAGFAGKFTHTGGRFPVTEPTHPLSVTTTAS